MEEKKNSGVFIIVFILALCVIGLAGYVVYDKVLSKNNNVVDNNQNQVQTNNNTVDQSTVNSLAKEVLNRYLSLPMMI